MGIIECHPCQAFSAKITLQWSAGNGAYSDDVLLFRRITRCASFPAPIQGAALGMDRL